MGLSNDIVSQFAKATKSTPLKNTETTYFATVVEYDGGYYAKLDGSEQLTPVLTTADIVPGERVTVLVKDHSATITGNITSPSARQSSVVALSGEVSQFGTILADKVDTVVLRAEQARIDDLYAENATITGTLTAQDASIKNLQTENITITGRLDVNEASIKNLEADNVNIKGTLTAYKADFDILDADVADINTLIFGSATGNVIQTSFANAVIAQLGTAQIKSAMIEDLSASKITTGDIITNNVRVMSEDGSLIISDETLQISDGTRVRVQIGKDAVNDYSINIWDADGNLMFSKGGITDSAIKDAIIRNDMVSDTANISAHKLDINTLFEAINEDGSNTLKATKIYLDDTSQTLEVAFTDMTTNIVYASQTANNALSAANNAQEDIDNLEIGATNLIRNSTNMIYVDYYFVTDESALSLTYLTDALGNVLLDEYDNKLIE